MFAQRIEIYLESMRFANGEKQFVFVLMFGYLFILKILITLAS